MVIPRCIGVVHFCNAITLRICCHINLRSLVLRMSWYNPILMICIVDISSQQLKAITTDFHDRRVGHRSMLSILYVDSMHDTCYVSEKEGMEQDMILESG